MPHSRWVAVCFAGCVGTTTIAACAEEPPWPAGIDDPACATPWQGSDARRRIESEQERPIREAGRVGAGVGAGIYNALGALGSISAHVFVHPRVLVEGELAVATDHGSERSEASSTSGAVSWRVLLRDTFNLRVGVIAREITQGAGSYQVQSEPRRDIGWVASLGNRWDLRSLFVQADWLGVAQPVASLASTRTPAAAEVRIAHVTAGIAF